MYIVTGIFVSENEKITKESSSAPRVAPLPPGTKVGNHVLNDVLSTGGFSYVYFSEDKYGIPVAIKEYIPPKLAMRDDDLHVIPANDEVTDLFYHGMKCFLEEGRSLIKIRHHNVVQIMDFIRENDTVYMVMKYEPGKTLHEYIVSKGLFLKEYAIRKIFIEAMDGLAAVHEKNIMHLDIKPANIYLRRNGSPMLLDFGSVRNSGAASSLFPPTLTHGFAAPEQYVKNADIGPWTDIYSIGASMYACIIGKGNPKLPSGKDRINGAEYKLAAVAGKARFTPGLLEMIDWCLNIDMKSRPQSSHELKSALLELSERSDPVAPSGVRNTFNKMFNSFL